MAKRFTMTWEPSKLRWRKMYRGKVYTVSCHALDAPPTKEGSYRQAAAWWEAQFAKIKSPPTRFDYVIEELEPRMSRSAHNLADETNSVSNRKRECISLMHW